MPSSPRSLAVSEAHVLVADDGGNLLWWDWPARRGPLVKAHDGHGPVAGDRWFATSRGWDPVVKRWTFGAVEPRYEVRPFNGRVTGLCIQGEDLIVAGADKSPIQVSSPYKDRVTLEPGGIVRIDSKGNATPLAVKTNAPLEQLVCGDDWILGLDHSRLIAVSDGQQRSISLSGGRATAVAPFRDMAVVADGGGIWIVDPRQATLTLLARADDTSLRVLALLAINDDVFGSTSEGVMHWPSGKLIARGGQQPAALARLGDDLLVLWEDGMLEQRTRSGILLRGEAVPRADINR